VVLATGVLPRKISLPGIDHPKVLSYVDVLKREVKVRVLLRHHLILLETRMTEPSCDTSNLDVFVCIIYRVMMYL